jgi:hypothetical protein
MIRYFKQHITCGWTINALSIGPFDGIFTLIYNMCVEKYVHRKGWICSKDEITNLNCLPSTICPKKNVNAFKEYKNVIIF